MQTNTKQPCSVSKEDGLYPEASRTALGPSRHIDGLALRTRPRAAAIDGGLETGDYLPRPGGLSLPGNVRRVEAADTRA